MTYDRRFHQLPSRRQDAVTIQHALHTINLTRCVPVILD